MHAAEIKGSFSQNNADRPRVRSITMPRYCAAVVLVRLSEQKAHMVSCPILSQKTRFVKATKVLQLSKPLQNQATHHFEPDECKSFVSKERFQLTSWKPLRWCSSLTPLRRWWQR